MNHHRVLQPKNLRDIYYLPVNFKYDEITRILKFMESKGKVNKSKFIKEIIFEKLDKEGY